MLKPYQAVISAAIKTNDPTLFAAGLRMFLDYRRNKKMIYAQYFDRGLISNKLTPACGDRSVVILDGRNSMATWKDEAVKFNGFRRPKYEAYQIYKGRNVNDSKPITDIILL